MREPALQRVLKARGALIVEQPFFGSLLLRVDIVEDSTCKRFWTDGVQIGFNPAFVDTLSLDNIKAILCHEILHITNLHHLRRNGREFETWNKSTDFAINPIIVDSNMQLPADVCLDRNFDGKSAEEIYGHLYKKPDPNGDESEEAPSQENDQDSGDNSDNSGDGQGDSSDDKQDSSGGDSSDDTGDSSDDTGDSSDDGSSNQDSQNSSKNGQDDTQDGGSGSGPSQDTNSNSQDSSSGSDGGCGEVRDYPDISNMSESEIEQQSTDWQIATIQAANQAKACGQLPGAIERMVKDLTEPKVCWQEALHRFVEQIAKNDYTWKKPNSRYIGSGFILPSLHNEQLPPIVVAVDTSGSVSSDDLKQFATEIDDILGTYETEILVVYCDTSVRHTETFTKENRPIVLTARGGGGTKFSPVFQYVDTLEKEPVCLVYLTDLESNDFGPEPYYPVLWVQTEGRKREVPWGEVIKM